MRMRVCIIAVLGIVAVFDGPALAYVDPGTGSYLFQIIIAAVIAIGFYFSRLKNAVKSIFHIFTKRKTSKQPQNHNERSGETG